MNANAPLITGHADQPGRPLVSVIVPTYNCASYLAEAVESALGQDYRPIEVVVADDASTDDTPSVLAALEKLESVRVLRLPHGGVSAARNAALRASTGPLVAFLDADDMWLPGKLSAQVAALQADPAAVLIHTGSELFGAQTGPGPIDPVAQAQIAGACFDKLARRNGIVVSSVMVRRTALPEQPFFPDLPQAEDYACWLGMLLEHRAVFLAQVLTRYRRRAHQLTADGSKAAQVWAGLARLRALALHRDRLGAKRHDELLAWTLDELHTCTYSRYWHNDMKMAALGFAALRSAGRSIPLRHRLWARLARRRTPKPAVAISG